MRACVASPAVVAGNGPPRTVLFADALAESLPEWLLFPGWQLAAALLVILASAYLSKLVVWVLARPVARRVERPGVRRVALGGARTLTVLAAVAVAAVLVGFEPGSILLSVTVISAVIGVVLAPIVRSVLSGMLVLTDKPYEVGDFVELDTGERGFVDEITIRYTKLDTLDNAYVLLSNSEMREREITNYSGEDERTRLSLRVGVAYEDDVSEARAIVERAARECEDVIAGGPRIRVGDARYPAAPTCYVAEFGDHGVVLTLRFWTTSPEKRLTVRSAIRTRILTDFEGAGIEVPYPHTHHVFDDTSGRARVELASDQAGADATVADGGVDEPSAAAVRRRSDADPREED